ncbi:decaprenyl-phosphate phosphoribosyltransferase [bacterium]|nr:decaprenyl-phosphate phosphoribosyltransferase [bacterium]
MRVLADLIVALRPRQWTKNLLVFAALLFAQKAADPTAVIEAVEAFLVFCLLAGGVYIINDALDVEQDRLDPIKRNRPLASGRLSLPCAVSFAVVLVVLGLVGAYLAAGTLLLKVALAYVGINLLYSGFLKHVVIIDVFAVASGFVLRAVAGAAAIHAVISPWLIICTLLLALFLALAKRRGELMTLGEEASNHRASLAEYSPELLDQMISVMTASTLMSYALYTISDRTVALVGSTNLLYTVPFVIYGIFRYLYLVHQKGLGGHPDRALLRDWPLMINVLLYAATVGIIIYLR